MSDRQWQRFQQFVSSPFYNRKAEFNSLLTILEEYRQKDVSNRWEEEVYQRWKGDGPYQQNLFRKACSYLVDLYHQFIGIERYQRSQERVKMDQVEGLVELGATRYFASAFDKSQQLIQNQSQSASVAYFWNKSNLHHIEINQQNLLAKRASLSGLDLALENLDQYYLLRKLKYLLAKYSQQQLLGNLSPEITPLDAIVLGMVERGPAHWHPIIKAYYMLFQAYQHPEDHSIYMDLKQWTLNELHEVDQDELRDFCTGLINYCSMQLRKGYALFDQEYGDIYQLMIDRDLLWIHGKILAWHIKNICIYHLARRQYAWVDNFLTLCKDRLIPSQSHQISLFCRGLIAYYKSNYKEARKSFELLLRKFDDVFYGLDARVVIARILYETNDSGLDYLLDAAPRFIRSKNIAQNQKLPRLNFFRFLKRLYFCRPHHKTKLKKLFKEISTAQNLSSKGWLIEQVQHRLETVPGF